MNTYFSRCFFGWAIPVSLNWALWYRVSYEASIKGQWSYPKAWPKKDHLLRPLVCLLARFSSMGCWTGALTSPLANGQGFPHSSMWTSLATAQLTARQLAFPEPVSEGSCPAFLWPNLRSAVPPPLPVVFTITELRDPGHSPGEGTAQRHGCQGEGTPGEHLRGGQQHSPQEQDQGEEKCEISWKKMYLTKFKIKSFSRLWVEGNFPNPIKGICGKPKAYVILHDERMGTFP